MLRRSMAVVATLCLCALVASYLQLAVAGPPALAAPAVNTDYVLLGWNDLGMHCYNRDFRDLAVLPPYNTLWAQVIRRGAPPEIVTGAGSDRVTVSYSLPDNSYSAGKSNFWDYEQALFGVDLAPNTGLTGRGLAGAMDAAADHFVADGIPLTEFRDSAPTTPYPYQLATLIAASGATELARTRTVAPVSTEMHCDTCHSDGGEEDISTGRVETNILTLHDEENDTDLMGRRPVLCATCHASNALGMAGDPELPSLSRAVHGKHAGEVAGDIDGCYSCHPGPQTRCLRDVMSQRGMGCTDCHGDMERVAANPNPWLNEPRCDGCHTDPIYRQDQALYRNSRGHGGVYCAGCHDSPHAIAPSSQPNDAIKFVDWQGHAGTLDTCSVCHTTPPDGLGPHGLPDSSALTERVYLPEVRTQ